MDRRTRSLFALALAVVVAVAAAAAILSRSDEPGEPGTELSVRGVVAGIESEGLDRIRSFSLRTDGGQILEFDFGNLQNGAAFPPGHLAEHQATGQPVLVFYVQQDGARVAVRIDDAP
jgi:hypothetical protein